MSDVAPPSGPDDDGSGATADTAISTLMGDDVEARKEFIKKNAKDVRFIDI